MAAYNVVRLRVKPEREKEFIQLSKALDQDMLDYMRRNGGRRSVIIKTGERSYCILGEWDDMASLVKARPVMIKQLDRMRDMLEDLGGGLGVTDPVSGEVIAEFS